MTNTIPQIPTSTTTHYHHTHTAGSKLWFLVSQKQFQSIINCHKLSQTTCKSQQNLPIFFINTHVATVLQQLQLNNNHPYDSQTNVDY